ncbi:ROK family protein [Gordonia sp. TBRC 11910]|uniref:ROK family protein n=1 Tax=Gordonia asplenii TaxID=2725283 RepID=A0A848L0C6_9ACTN|nr:ROK family protein [Gordonia asplenii]NMO04410.1 ROK family protein [Gordonia asplenii]
MSRYLGVDLGGTGTRIVALDGAGRVVGDTTAPTRHDDSTQAVAALIDSLAALVGDEPVGGVGIGASGPVDSDGIIHNRATLPAYSELQITGLIADAFGVDCRIDNDAATAAIGEQRFGAGAGSRAMLMVTLGTGVGVTMLVDGAPFRAADGAHPELGHIAVDGPAAPCYCGLPTCWEQLASRTSLDGSTGGRRDDAAAAARSGDSAALRLFETYGTHVGAGLETLISAFHPDEVVIGGSVAQYLDLYRAPLLRRLMRSADYAWDPSIRAGTLGNLAGAIGAAALVLPRVEHAGG